MKRLLLLMALMVVPLLQAQSEDDMATPNIDTLTVEFQVLNINGNKAQIMTSHLAKKYEVSITPEINPFGYVLAADREYTIRIERDMNQVKEFQTRGQTRTLPARMLWFAPTEIQLKRDKLWMSRFTEVESSNKAKE